MTLLLLDYVVFCFLLSDCFFLRHLVYFPFLNACRLIMPGIDPVIIELFAFKNREAPRENTGFSIVTAYTQALIHCLPPYRYLRPAVCGAITILPAAVIFTV